MISKLDEGDRTEGPLGRDNDGAQAVLTANADESEPELAWADPGVGEINGKVLVTDDN